VSHKSGTGAYGVAFVESDSTFIRPFAFVVDSARRFAVVNPDSLTISPQVGVGVYGALGTDTIEVMRFGSKCVCMINGAVQDTVAIPSDFRIDGAGLYAGTKTALICSRFIAGGDSTGAFCIPNSVTNTPFPGITSYTRAFGNDCVVYDLMGRKIGRYDRTTFAGARLSKGLYFVVPSGAKAGSVMPLRLLNVRN
jgi:hypothetical protein